MRPRKIFTGLGCSIRAVPFQLRIRQYSTRQSNSSSHNLSWRQSLSTTKTARSQATAQKLLLQPPILHSSTAYNYTPQKRDKMKPQSIQIPGLTLLNNLTPHAIAPTSEGGFISAGAAPKSQVAATTAKTTIPPPKKKENKKAKARRLLAEAQAQAQAQAQAAASHNGYGHNQDQYESTFFSLALAFFYAPFLSNKSKTNQRVYNYTGSTTALAPALRAISTTTPSDEPLQPALASSPKTPLETRASPQAKHPAASPIPRLATWPNP